jgi:hypothetical protein
MGIHHKGHRGHQGRNGFKFGVRWIQRSVNPELQTPKPRMGIHHRGIEDTKLGTDLSLASAGSAPCEPRTPNPELRTPVNGKRPNCRSDRRMPDSVPVHHFLLVFVPGYSRPCSGEPVTISHPGQKALTARFNSELRRCSPDALCAEFIMDRQARTSRRDRGETRGKTSRRLRTRRSGILSRQYSAPRSC